MPSLARRVKTLTLGSSDPLLYQIHPTQNSVNTVIDYTISDPDFPIGLVPPTILEFVRRDSGIETFSLQEPMIRLLPGNMSLVRSDLGTGVFGKFIDGAYDVNHPSQLSDFLGLVFGTPNVLVKIFLILINPSTISFGFTEFLPKLSVSPPRRNHSRTASARFRSPNVLLRILGGYSPHNHLRTLIGETLLPIYMTDTPSSPNEKNEVVPPASTGPASTLVVEPSPVPADLFPLPSDSLDWVERIWASNSGHPQPADLRRTRVFVSRE